MPRNYLMLRMASARDLTDATAWAPRRSRYYSTPADLRGDDDAGGGGNAPPLPRLSVASNRQPNLRRAASAAVRSADDVAALSAAWSASAWRPLVRVAHAADEDGNGSVQVHEVLSEDEVEEEIGIANEDEEDTRPSLAKETMFALAAVIVLLTSGGLILGFGPVYAALVREGQWAELCRDARDAAGTKSSPQEQQQQQPCARQEIHLQYVFSTSFMCLSAANACFGVILDVFGPRLTAILGLALSVAGNFALSYGDSSAGTGVWIIGGYAMIGAGGMGAYLAAFQLLQLYRVQGFVCSTLSSLFNCSGYIYMALEIDAVTRPVFFRVYGCAPS